MEFITNEKLTIVGAAGMIGSADLSIDAHTRDGRTLWSIVTLQR